MEEEEVSNDKGKKCAAPPVYASWSEGARKLDEEMQKNLETPDERRLASIVAGLGHYETTESDWHERPELFVKGPKCLEKLKELQRCLTRDNPDRRRIFLQLGSWNVAGRYIVPIIMRYPEDFHLFLTALKVAILLTVPVDRTSDNTCDQVDYLCQLKDEFRERNVIGAIVAHLEEPLEHMEKGAVTEDDWRLLQLVLTLFENLLAVPESMNWVGPYPVARYSHLRDGILECMFRESATDILLAIARNLPAYKSGIRRDNLLILQVVHHIFWGQKPEVLVTAATNEGGKQEKAQTEAARPQALIDDERERKRKLQMKNLPRHSHFSGTFVRVEQDGSKTMLVRNPFQRREDILEKRSELGLNGRKEKPFARDVDVPLPSRDNISALLKGYADQFLATGGYNALMQTVKDDIRRDSRRIEVSDVVTFFQVAQFFTSYQHYHFSLKQEIRGDAVDELTTQGRFCSHISSTMDEEMFKMVMSKWLEYLEAAKTPNDWIQVVATGALLKEMIYILDMVLKNRSEDAQRDSRMARTLLYKLFYDQTENGILNTTYRAIKAFSIYRHPRSHLSNMVAITHVVLRLTEGLTREEGALRVSKKVRKRKSKRTHADNSKDVAVTTENSQTLTNNVENGHANTEAANLDRSTHPVEQIHIDDGEKQPEEVQAEGEDDEEDDGLTREFTLDVRRCVEKFADNAIISKYCWLLMFYNSNSPALNYYIVCMLQRICKDCILEPMLYQASILEKFQAILSDKKIAELDEYKSLVSFVSKVVRNFFKKLKSNPLLYVDVLFVKNRKLCHEITADYMIHKLKGETRGSGMKRRCISDALGEDEGGTFNQMSSDYPSSQAGEHGVALRKAATKPKRRRGPFSADDDTRITELYEQFKQRRSCSRLIAEALNPEGNISAAQMTRRLKQLGLRRFPAKSKSTSEHVIEPSDTENNEGQLENNEESEIDTSSSEDADTCQENEMNKWEIGKEKETRERVSSRKRRLVKPRDRINSIENIEQYPIPKFQQESEDEDTRETSNKKLVKQHDDVDIASNLEEPNIFYQQESGGEDDHHEGLNESEHTITEDTANLQQECGYQEGQHHQSLSNALPERAPTRRKRLVKQRGDTRDMDVYIDSSNMEDLIDANSSEDIIHKEVTVNLQAKRRAITITED